MVTKIDTLFNVLHKKQDSTENVFLAWMKQGKFISLNNLFRER